MSAIDSSARSNGNSPMSFELANPSDSAAVKRFQQIVASPNSLAESQTASRFDAQAYAGRALRGVSLVGRPGATAELTGFIDTPAFGGGSAPLVSSGVGVDALVNLAPNMDDAVELMEDIDNPLLQPRPAPDRKLQLGAAGAGMPLPMDGAAGVDISMPSLGNVGDLWRGFRAGGQSSWQILVDSVGYLSGQNPAFIAQEKPIDVPASVAGIAGNVIGSFGAALFTTLQPTAQGVEAQRKYILETDVPSAAEFDRLGATGYSLGVVDIALGSSGLNPTVLALASGINEATRQTLLDGEIDTPQAFVASVAQSAALSYSVDILGNDGMDRLGRIGAGDATPARYAPRPAAVEAGETPIYRIQLDHWAGSANVHAMASSRGAGSGENSVSGDLQGLRRKLTQLQNVAEKAEKLHDQAYRDLFSGAKAANAGAAPSNTDVAPFWPKRTPSSAKVEAFEPLDKILAEGLYDKNGLLTTTSGVKVKPGEILGASQTGQAPIHTLGGYIRDPDFTAELGKWTAPSENISDDKAILTALLEAQDLVAAKSGTDSRLDAEQRRELDQWIKSWPPQLTQLTQVIRYSRSDGTPMMARLDPNFQFTTTDKNGLKEIFNTQYFRGPEDHPVSALFEYYPAGLRKQHNTSLDSQMLVRLKSGDRTAVRHFADKFAEAIPLQRAQELEILIVPVPSSTPGKFSGLNHLMKALKNRKYDVVDILVNPTYRQSSAQGGESGIAQQIDHLVLRGRPNSEKYQRIVLVDDVLTTGTTMSLAQQALEQNISNKIKVYPLALGVTTNDSTSLPLYMQNRAAQYIRGQTDADLLISDPQYRQDWLRKWTEPLEAQINELENRY